MAEDRLRLLLSRNADVMSGIATTQDVGLPTVDHTTFESDATPRPAAFPTEATHLSTAVLREEMESRGLEPSGFFSSDCALLQKAFDAEFIAETGARAAAEEARKAAALEAKLAATREQISSMLLEEVRRFVSRRALRSPRALQSYYWTSRYSVSNCPGVPAHCGEVWGPPSLARHYSSPNQRVVWSRDT